MKDSEIFEGVLNRLSEEYPGRGLVMDGTVVSADGAELFDTEGHNLLRNLTALCGALGGELL